MPALAAPPSGTVTFLFTDIQGSTKLWEQYPDTMRPALARHDELLRRSIETHNGYVFKTVGDAFCAAFPDACQALDAALAAQLALGAEAWETETPLLVRMALHTGEAEERGGDYFGPPLNRVARLMATGHGGQTLLSGVVYETVQDALPPSVALLDLGRHRLKDLGRPEQVYQLQHPALPDGFAPLRSLDNARLPNNLPQQPTSFIGREKQIADIKALLAETRLLTLTGAGGSGKTRLSLQAAADLLDGEGDGVWLVELAGLSDPALVPQAVADVLDVPEQAGQPMQRTLAEALKPKRLLLVLDNCEHLVSACASLAADLLRSCPGVHLLASSREALNVSGERTYRVPTLSLPDPKRVQTAASLLEFESVRLFTERAQAVQPSFMVSDGNAGAVSAVCSRLDGIPLALELAAARVRSLPVDEINTRLDNRFRLLTGGSRTALPRQQTLRALVDWSYDLLTAQEKVVLRRLSAFAGGWTLDAAEAVCSGAGVNDQGIEDWEVLDLLTSLLDKSLVMYDDSPDGGRYGLLETVRQYAGDRLAESGEADAVQGRAAAWFLDFAEKAEAQMTGPEQATWYSRLETEHDNLRASLSRYERQADGVGAGLRLCGAIWRFWWVHGHCFEGRERLNKALSKPWKSAAEEGGPETPTIAASRAKALGAAGSLAYVQGDMSAAQVMFEECLGLFRQQADSNGTARSLSSLGNVANVQGDLSKARALYQESLALIRQSDGNQADSQNLIARSINNLGNVAQRQRDFAAARELFEESLSIQRRLGDTNSIAGTLTDLGLVAADQGDHTRARVLYEESLTILRGLGGQQGIAEVLHCLGKSAYRLGDSLKARALYEESLVIRRQIGDRQGMTDLLSEMGTLEMERQNYPAAWAFYQEGLTIQQQLASIWSSSASLEGLAGVALGEDRPARAARLLGAAASLRIVIDNPLLPVDEETIGRRVASAREALGEDAFAADWAAGQAMTAEQAVEYALSQE